MKRILAFSFLATALLAPASKSAPSAVLVRVKGKVTVLRGGKSLVGKDGFQLQTGDKVIVNGGTATVFALGAPPKTLKNGSLTVATPGAAKTGVWKNVYSGLSRGLNAPTRTVSATMRPGDVLLMSPVNSRIETALPRLEWRPASGVAVQGYRVQVFGGAKMLWSTETESTSVEYPFTAPALSGTVRWQVLPLNRKEDGAWAVDGNPSEFAAIHIATQAQLTALRADLTRLAGQTKTLSAEDQLLARAGLLNALGFKLAALRELGSGNDASVKKLRESIWGETEQYWRLAPVPASQRGTFVAVAPPTSAPLTSTPRPLPDSAGPEEPVADPLPLETGIGEANPGIVALDPAAPVKLSKLKRYVSPDGLLAMEVPWRFSANIAAVPNGIQLTQLGTIAPSSASFIILMAPGAQFPEIGSLRQFLVETQGQPNAKTRMEFGEPKAAPFRDKQARSSTWKLLGNGVESTGSMMEWREGELACLISWGGPAGAEKALQPLLKTLQIGPQVKPPELSPGLMELGKQNMQNLQKRMSKESGAAVKEMKELDARLMQSAPDKKADKKPDNSTVTAAAFEKQDAKRHKTAPDSYERADAARQSAQLAARLAWKASESNDTPAAQKYFEKQFALEDEAFNAEIAATEAEIRSVGADLALWTNWTAPGPLAQVYEELTSNLYEKRIQLDSRQVNMALQRQMTERSAAPALDAVQAQLELLEVASLEPANGGAVLRAKLLLAQSLDALGGQQQLSADFDGSRAYYESALRWRMSMPESFANRNLARSWYNIATLNYATGDLVRARENYGKALAEADANASRRERDLQNQDVKTRAAGQFFDAEVRANSLRELSSVQAALGDLTASRNSIDKAITVAQALPNDQGFQGARTSLISDTLQSKGNLLGSSGDFEGAQKLLAQAADVARAAGDNNQMAMVQFSAALIDNERGQTAAAQAKLDIARPIFVQLGGWRMVMWCDLLASRLAFQKNDYAAAATAAKAALTLARSKNDWMVLTRALRMLANVRLANAGETLSATDRDEITAIIAEIETIDARAQNVNSEIATLGLKARLQEKSGDPAGAFETLQGAIERLERLRATSDSSDRFSDIKVNYDLYDQAVRLLLQLNRPEEAIDMLSRARSKKLSDTINVASFKSSDAQTQQSIDRLTGLDEKLAKTRTQLALEKSRPEAQRDPVKLKNLGNAMASTQKEFFAVSAQLKARNPRFDTSVSILPTQVKKVQRFIPKGTLILQFAVLDDGLYIFAITSESIKIYNPKAAKADVQKAVRAYRASITADMKAVAGGLAPSSIDDPATPLRVASESLSKMLLLPVQSEIEAAQTVAIVPSGELFYVPVHALGSATADGKWHFLIEDKPVAYLAKGDVLSVVATRNENEGGRGLLAMGDPTGAELPASKTEVQAIAKLFPGSQTLIGQNATKASMLLPASLNKRIIHLAAHGVLNSAQPQQSFIQLSPTTQANGKGDDGKLRVGEIKGIDMNKVDLVTLSACQTALGEGQPDGTEIASLAESFSSAGTPTVVASLWNVEDQSTAKLMESFYGGLAGGKPKGVALQQAQISLLRSAATRHPFFWAPFELLGDWR